LGRSKEQKDDNLAVPGLIVIGI